MQATLDFVLPPASIDIKDATCHRAISRIFRAFYERVQESLDFEGIEEEDDDPGEKLWALVLHADIFLEVIAGGLGSA